MKTENTFIVSLVSHKNFKNLFPFFIIGIICFIVLFPLFKPGVIITDDGNWMIIRLSAFYQSWREGQFPVRFLGRLNNSYGYPVANFLYPGYLYLGSLLHIIGIPFTSVVKYIVAGSVFTAGVFIYLWLRRYFSVVSSCIGSCYFVTGPYLLFDIYKRGSVGEVLAIALGAVCLYLIESKKYLFFGLFFALLIIGHNSIALLFTIFFLLLLLYRKEKEGIIALLFGLGNATFFWFPALFEKSYVTFDRILVSNPIEYFISGSNILALGVPSLVAVVWYFIAKPTKIFKMYVVYYVVATLLATPLSQSLWQIEPLARLFQFPYRLLSISLFFGTYVVAGMIERLPLGLKKLFFGFIIFVAFLQIVPVFKTVMYSYEPEGYYSTNEATTTVANEYMPVWVKEITAERPTVRLSFHKGRGSITVNIGTTQRIDAHIVAEEDSTLQINSIYYPGWGVLVNDIPVQLNYDNPNGVIRFNVPKGKHHIIAEFRETIPRFLADVVSLISLCALCVYGILKRVKKTFLIQSKVNR